MDKNNMFLAAQDDLYSRAWNQLLSDPDDLITDLLVDKARELITPGLYEPKKEDAQRFLSVYLEQAKIKMHPIPKPPKDVTTPLATFTFRNQRYEIEFWYEYLVNFCETLSQMFSDRFDEVLEFRGKKGRIFFSRNRDDVLSPKLVPGTDIYVYTCFDRKGIMQTVKNLAGFFGVEEPVKE